MSEERLGKRSTFYREGDEARLVIGPQRPLLMTIWLTMFAIFVAGAAWTFLSRVPADAEGNRCMSCLVPGAMLLYGTLISFYILAVLQLGREELRFAAGQVISSRHIGPLTLYERRLRPVTGAQLHRIGPVRIARARSLWGFFPGEETIFLEHEAGRELVGVALPAREAEAVADRLDLILANM